MDFSIKTLSNGTKELYVDEKLIASGTQEEILSIMRLMIQHEALEKSSNDEGRETRTYSRKVLDQPAVHNKGQI